MGERNWVNVKVPEEIRNEAKKDDRTYWEIMRDGLENPDVPEEIQQIIEESMQAVISDGVEAQVEAAMEDLDIDADGGADSEALEDLEVEVLELHDEVDQMMKWLDGIPIETADEVEARLSTHV